MLRSVNNKSIIMVRQRVKPACGSGLLDIDTEIQRGVETGCLFLPHCSSTRREGHEELSLAIGVTT